MPLPPLHARRRAPTKILEAAVSKQIRDFLEAKGWRPIRQQSGKFMNPYGMVMTVGERGMADFLYLRYLQGARPGATLSLWIETKREGYIPRCDCASRLQAGKTGNCTACAQADWRKREEVRGALFGPGESFERFEAWYRATFGWLHDGSTVKGQVDLFS